MSQTQSTATPDAKRPKKHKQAKPPLSFDKMTGAEIEAMPPDEFSDALFAKMEAAEPQLTCEDMDKIEAVWMSQKRDRRMALVMLTKPWAWLNQQVSKDRDFAKAVAEVEQYASRASLYKGLAEMMETAVVWCMLALAGREDMQELCNEAKAEYEA
jgi:hypothetical protein